MFGKKDNIQSLIRKTEKANKKKKNNAEKSTLTPEQQLQRLVFTVLGVSTAITVVFAVSNFSHIKNYDPAINTTLDTERIDDIKNFIANESTDKYTELIDKHSNEEQNNRLDIQTVHSSVTREYPFANILNRTQDNISTKICKFLYSELKPAIISYNMANGVYPFVEDESGSLGLENVIDLDLLKELINIKDNSLKSYTYVLTNLSSSAFKITVLDGENVIPIVLFDPTQFTVKEINENEVNLIQGKYSLILKPMEEYNNIRLKSININGSSKSCTIVDTTTNKVVKITVN